MAFPFGLAIGGGLSLLDSIFGRGSSQSYRFNPYEKELLNILRPSLNLQGATNEVRRAYEPDIRGLQNYFRATGSPYGGGAEIATQLQGETSILDILAKAGLQRQGQAQNLYASLASGKGTQTAQSAPDLSSLGYLLGYYFPQLFSKQQQTTSSSVISPGKMVNW